VDTDIRTNSQDFNPAYTLFYDHTTGTGNMMLLDGFPAGGEIAWTETVSVTTNAQYIFSARPIPETRGAKHLTLKTRHGHSAFLAPSFVL
jgi:hypothetical protein